MEGQIQDPWLLSPSGSRAEDSWTTEDKEFTTDAFYGTEDWSYAVVTADQELDAEEAASYAITYGTGDLQPGQLMSPKVPPSFDGKSSWFAYEELIYDWEDMTVLDEDKRGPALRNRLIGNAAIYKPSLDRTKLKEKGYLEYFIQTIRPNFVKSAQNVFLYRLMQFLNQRRQKLDIHRWIARYELQKKRLFDAWMDLNKPLKDDTSEGYSIYYDRLDRKCRSAEPPTPLPADIWQFFPI